MPSPSSGKEQCPKKSDDEDKGLIFKSRDPPYCFLFAPPYG